jgi:hypothetical protein
MRYLVIGAAGHAQEVAWSLREQIRSEGGRCELRFFDDRVQRGPLACGLGEVVGTIDAVPEHAGDGARLVLGVGLPRTKVALVERLAPLGLPSGQPSSIPEPPLCWGRGHTSRRARSSP